MIERLVSLKIGRGASVVADVFTTVTKDSTWIAKLKECSYAVIQSSRRPALAMTKHIYIYICSTKISSGSAGAEASTFVTANVAAAVVAVTFTETFLRRFLLAFY